MGMRFVFLEVDILTGSSGSLNHHDNKHFTFQIYPTQMVRLPLMECVKRTQDVQAAMDKCDWELAVLLRGKSFQRNLATYRLLTKLYTPAEKACFVL